MKHTPLLLAACAALAVSAAAVAQAPVEQRGSVAPVYDGRASAGGARVIESAPLPNPAAGGPLAGGASPAADAQARLDALEEEMRQLRGQIEQQDYTIDQLRRQLEQARATAPTPTAPQPPIAQTPPVTGAAPVGTPQPLAGTAPSSAPAAPTAATTPQAGLGTAAATLPGSAATSSYSQAFALLQQGNYPAAEQGFRAFLQAKPSDPLAGNAQYWLAETYYVRKDYGRAAQEFLKGYQTYPTGSKAPDSLLKLSLSLASLGQTQQACKTLAQLAQDYPSLSRTLSDRATQERQRVACP